MRVTHAINSKLISFFNTCQCMHIVKSIYIKPLPKSSIQLTFVSSRKLQSHLFKWHQTSQHRVSFAVLGDRWRVVPCGDRPKAHFRSRLPLSVRSCWASRPRCPSTLDREARRAQTHFARQSTHKSRDLRVTSRDMSDLQLLSRASRHSTTPLVARKAVRPTWCRHGFGLGLGTARSPSLVALPLPVERTTASVAARTRDDHNRRRVPS